MSFKKKHVTLRRQIQITLLVGPLLSRNHATGFCTGHCRQRHGRMRRSFLLEAEPSLLVETSSRGIAPLDLWLDLRGESVEFSEATKILCDDIRNIASKEQLGTEEMGTIAGVLLSERPPREILDLFKSTAEVLFEENSMLYDARESTSSFEGPSGRCFYVSDDAAAMTVVPDILSNVTPITGSPSSLRRISRWLNVFSGPKTAWASLLLVVEAIGGSDALNGSASNRLGVRVVDEQQVVDAAIALIRSESTMILNGNQDQEKKGDAKEMNHCLVLPLDIQVWRAAILFASESGSFGLS